MSIDLPNIAERRKRSDYRAADAIVDHLERQIISGELPDGSTLPAERDLMVRFMASRTVVREAITSLSSRGLIENRPRFRPVVRTPNFHSAFESIDGSIKFLLNHHEGVQNLYESRIFIERMLVRDAATSARKADMENLTSALADNKEAIKHPNDFYRTDMAFHRILYDIPDNPVFPAVHCSFTRWLEPYWLKLPRSAERNLVNYLGHESIYSAIVARDPDAAETALSRHLNAAWEYVRVTFDE